MQEDISYTPPSESVKMQTLQCTSTLPLNKFPRLASMPSYFKESLANDKNGCYKMI